MRSEDFGPEGKEKQWGEAHQLKEDLEGGGREEERVREREMQCLGNEDAGWRWMPEGVGREWISSTASLRKEDESRFP